MPSIVSKICLLVATAAVVSAEVPTPPVNSMKCADENGDCECIGTVYYGAGVNWNTEVLASGTIACTNAVFGDPIVNTKKECQCAPPPTPPAGSIKCADENGDCECIGTVYYGAGVTWNTEASTDTVACTNAVFGDPIVNTKKECQCFSGPPACTAPFVQYSESRALELCAHDQPVKPYAVSYLNAKGCDENDTPAVRDAIANGMFGLKDDGMWGVKNNYPRDCSSWCLWDLTSKGATKRHFKWDNRQNKKCWKRKSGSKCSGNQGGEQRNALAHFEKQCQPKFADGICTGTADEFSSDALQITNNDAGTWFTDAARATGICNIYSVERCRAICADVQGCNYFSITDTQACHACFVHKTCETPTTAGVNGAYTVYNSL